MNKSREESQSGRSKLLVHLAVFLVPCLLFLSVISRYSHDFPWNDDVSVGLRVAAFHEAEGFSQKAHLLLRQHNEHRIAMTMAISLLLDAAGVLDFSILAIIGSVSLPLISIFFVLWSAAPSAPRNSIGLFAIFPLLSLGHGPTLVWAMTSISQFWVYLFFLLSYALLLRRQFLLSLVAALFCVYTTANGVLIFLPAVFLLLFHTHRSREIRRQWTMYSVITLVFSITYFVGYHRPASASTSLPSITEAGRYFFTVMGLAPSFGIQVWALPTGLLLVVLFLFLTSRNLQEPRGQLWIAMGIFSLLSSLVIAAGRAQWGLGSVFVSRYYVHSAVLMACCLPLLSLTVARVKKKRWRLAAVALCAGVSLTACGSQLGQLEELRDRKRLLKQYTLDYLFGDRIRNAHKVYTYDRLDRIRLKTSFDPSREVINAVLTPLPSDRLRNRRSRLADPLRIRLDIRVGRGVSGISGTASCNVAEMDPPSIQALLLSDGKAAYSVAPSSVRCTAINDTPAQPGRLEFDEIIFSTSDIAPENYRLFWYLPENDVVLDMRARAYLSPEKGRIPDTFVPFGEPTALALAVCGEMTHYAWLRGPRDGDARLLYRSCDGQFPCSRMAVLASRVAPKSAPSITCEGRAVLVVWEDVSHGSSDIAYRRSTDAGASYGPLRYLTRAPGQESNAVVKTSQGHTLVVWEDRRKGTVDLGFRRSADMGASWDPLLFLAASSVQESEPALAASGDLALVSWIAHQEGKYAVMYRRSSDGGISWSSSSSLARSTTKLSHPVIAADAEVVLVGWLDRGRENEDFAVRRSVDRGDTFEASWFLVRTPVDDSEPVLLLSGTDAFAAWAEALDRNWRFSSRRSPNAGGAWESTLRLGRTSIRKTYMACDSDELHVACAWMATLDDHPMPVTLHSIDGGRRWQGTWPLE